MQESTEERLGRLSPAQRAALVSELRARRAAQRPVDRVPSVGRDEPLPLSFAQQRLWLLHQWAEGKPLYNTSLGLRLHGPLDPELLRRAVIGLVGRHEALRTHYFNTPDGPRQRPGTVADDDLFTMVDLSEIDPAQRESWAADVVTKAGRRGFDLARDPSLRATLVRMAADDHLLVLAAHHIATDAWSTEVLTKELIEFYTAGRAGRPPVLPVLPIQYADFASWERGPVAQAERAASLDYWRGTLAGLDTVRFPTDRPRPVEPSWAGEQVQRLLPAKLHRELLSLGGPSTRVMPMALAGLAAVISRYTGQNDIVAGTTFAGRTRPELEPLIGYFANTVVLRVSTAGAPGFRELLARAGDTVYSAHTHQNVPFDQLVSELHPARDLNTNPLFQVALLQTNELLKPVRMADVDVVTVPLHSGTARFDFTLSVAERSAGGIEMGIEFATDLFDRARMDRLLAHLERLLESGVSRPDAPLHELDLLTEPERIQLTTGWNDTATPATTAEPSIGAAFDAQVLRTPGTAAVKQGGAVLDYSAVQRRAHQIAHRLLRAGAGPGSLVGVSVSRTVDVVPALLGVLKVGAAYVPLDPKYPAGRLGSILADAEPVAVLCDAVSRAVIETVVTEPGNATTLIDLSDETLGDESVSAPPVRVTAGMPAYVSYTSGSTGKPKGVIVAHRNVLNLYTELDRRLGSEPPGTWLAVSSISFDISVLELLWTLSRGFTVVLAEADPATLLATSRRNRRAAATLDFGLFYFASDDDAAESGSDRYRLLLEGAKFADRNGFSAVWTPERHFHAFGGQYPAPSVTAAALAMVTDRISIRAGSVVLPLHHPVRVAEEWSVVDNLSNGRVGMALASGWHHDDFVFAPENYAERKKVMLEGIETVRSLWRGESVPMTGGTGAGVDVRIRPAPVQAELPMWLSSAGSPDTFRAAARAGLGVLTHLLGQDLDSLAEKIAAYRETWREHHGTDGGHVALMVHTFVDPDRDHALATARGPFTRYLGTSLDLLRGLAKGLGMEFDSLGEDDRAALLDHAADRYLSTGGLFGTPADCAEFAWRLSQVGVDEIACLIDFGIDPEQVLASLPQLDIVRRAFQTRREQKREDTEDTSLAALIREHGVTHLQCTPTLAGFLAADPGSADALAALRVLFVGGEAMPADLARRLAELTPAALHNMYGPTETTVWSTAELVDGLDAEAGSVPIGLPLANETAYVLDNGMHPQPVGVVGELYLGGDGVAAGYHRHPALTARQFVPDPFGGQGKQLYRTGDLARRLADGRLEFLGRRDDQVKIRGHRVELGEIEAVLLSHPGVRSAAVAMRGEPGTGFLVGYVVPEDGIEQPDDAALRLHLRDALPEHMVPARFSRLESFPLTPNGKVDRKNLPDPGGTTTAAQYEPPATHAERVLAEVWQDVLGIGRIGVRSGFFDLGGNSISVVLVVDKANRRGVPITARQLFAHQTIRELAGVAETDDPADPIVALQPSGSAPPLLCLHASTGSSLPYVALSQELGSDRPCYAVELPKELPGELSVARLAGLYADAIRARWPDGPHHLVGWSLGGSLAVAVAAELREAGGQVGLLALLDTAAPAVPAVEVPLPVAIDGFVRSVAEAADIDVASDIGELGSLEPDEQFAVALDRLDAAGLLPAGQRAEMLARARVFVELTTAVSRWEPGPFRGELTLIRPARSTTTAAGWESLVDGPVRTATVPGNHFTMTKAANAAGLATLLTDLATRAEAATDPIAQSDVEVHHAR
ncbi:MupA/Atu3671 family FMN-dependent luciferase-like monooxygenase [Amycolatopsis sp. cmx-11-12]|uniref:LLM class flavin-dependent oxidoreductase n=1 Tax=Amycolatopsis sp. cmx-11-12 TaxID=2785795 RepID=UPI0039180A8A